MRCVCRNVNNILAQFHDTEVSQVEQLPKKNHINYLKLRQIILCDTCKEIITIIINYAKGFRTNKQQRNNYEDKTMKLEPIMLSFWKETCQIFAPN